MTVSTMTKTSTTSLEFDRDQFRSKFPDHAFKFPHHLCDRPELTLPRIVELAQKLPKIEYFSGNVGVSQTSKTYPRNGLSIAETVRRIEECGSWMVLWNIEDDPEYNTLVRGLRNEWYGQIDADQKRRLGTSRHRERAFLFISSPNAVTPFHVDDEHNILLQIRGSKKIFMYDVKDRATMPESQAEDMLQAYRGLVERYLPYEESFQQRATEHDLPAGEGLHFPFAGPHWVQNGPAVSISLSVTFRSDFSERLAKIYTLNRKLRKLGLEPTPPEQSDWRDSLKISAFDAARGARKIVKKLV